MCRLVLFSYGYHVYMCLSCYFSGGMTKARFHTFLESIAAGNGTPLCFVFDNASSHRSAALESANGGPNLGQHRVVFLPPYSPFLNLVENAISAFKADLKKELEEIRPHLLTMEADQREATLTQLAEQSVAVITPAKSQNWFHRSQGYIPSCIQQLDILI